MSKYRANLYPAPAFAWGEVAVAMRRDGETAFEAMERQLCEEAMWRFNGDQTSAAAWYGTTRGEFASKCRRFGMRICDRLRVAS